MHSFFSLNDRWTSLGMKVSSLLFYCERNPRESLVRVIKLCASADKPSRSDLGIRAIDVAVVRGGSGINFRPWHTCVCGEMFNQHVRLLRSQEGDGHEHRVLPDWLMLYLITSVITLEKIIVKNVFALQKAKLIFLLIKKNTACQHTTVHVLLHRFAYSTGTTSEDLIPFFIGEGGWINFVMYFYCSF